MLQEATGFTQYMAASVIDLVFCPSKECGRWAVGVSRWAGSGQCTACSSELFKNSRALSRTRYMKPEAVATDIANNPDLAGAIKDYHPTVSIPIELALLCTLVGGDLLSTARTAQPSVAEPRRHQFV
jgi:hypothetical protein